MYILPMFGFWLYHLSTEPPDPQAPSVGCPLTVRDIHTTIPSVGYPVGDPRNRCATACRGCTPIVFIAAYSLSTIVYFPYRNMNVHAPPTALELTRSQTRRVRPLYTKHDIV